MLIRPYLDLTENLQKKYRSTYLSLDVNKNKSQQNSEKNN